MPQSRKTKFHVTEAELDDEERALKRVVGRAKLIPGVYNHCDRWCERCPLTRRCLLFKLQNSRGRRRKGRAAGPADDLNREDFWDDLGTNFAVALRLIYREAKKRGIDLDAPDLQAEVVREEETRLRRAAREGSQLHRAALGYWRTAKMVLVRLKPELATTEEALNVQARIGSGDPRSVAAEINDALDVIQWYLYLIDEKLQRAISSRVDEEADSEKGLPSDADGSAKVALIGIDRSISAWARLRQQLSSEGDAILDLLVQLERLRRNAEREFPRARAFKRVGFD